MLIFFDCTSAQPSANIAVNGGGEYSIRVLVELINTQKKVKNEIVLLLSDQKGINKKIEELYCETVIKCEYSSLKNLEDIINNRCPDRIIFPIFYPEYANISVRDGCIIIGLIHDMSTFYQEYLGNHIGKYYKLDKLNWLRKIVNFVLRKRRMKRYLNQHKQLFFINDSTYIYTVSYFTKSMLEYFISNANVLGVFYSPLKITECFSEQEEQQYLKKTGLLDTPFFLLTNVGRWAKNNMRAIIALDNMFSNIGKNKILNQYSVVLLGANDAIIKYINTKIHNKKRFIIKSFVSDQEMEILYKNAYAYIYPSLLEGFGYPPIEAMKYGTLSICSNSSSIPEVCGDAVIYFDPVNIDSISMAIMRSLNVEYYNLIKNKIESQYKYIISKQQTDLEKLMSVLLN